MDKETAKYYYDNNIKIKAKTAVYNDLVNSTQHLPGKLFPKQRLWHIINDVSTIPSCKICNNYVKWDDAQPLEKQQYRVYCCVKCSRKDSDVSIKKLQTELERYGEGRKSVVEKIKQTNNERYGANYAIQTETFKQKQASTNISRYGVENVIQNTQVVSKRKQTNLERYGVAAPCQNEIIKQKMFNTNNERYGVYYPSIANIKPESLAKLEDRQWMEEQHITNKLKFSDIASELQVHQSTVVRYLRKHGVDVIYHNHSSKQLQIQQFIEQHYSGEIFNNNRSIIAPLELDIVLPELNFAIEFNGIYRHSELSGKHKNYHLNKTMMAGEQGLQLMHIWENEWDHSPHIVMSRLLNVLSKSMRIHARDCVFGVLDKDTTKQFFIDNHLQGFVPGQVYCGLLYENRLVAAAIYGASRFNQYQYELLRMCNLVNHAVIGGSSKLHSNFVRLYQPDSVVSFGDRRYGTGSVYKQMKFVFSHNSSPSYHYFHKNRTNVLFSRLSFQKHKLKDKLEFYDENLSEWQNMINNGYDRIWDCGNSVWVWTNH